ncbi:MAG: (d)CMP kinase [Planctomycetota bacterium]
MPKNPVVAIDGPAGSGKSTAARLLARRLGYTHVDTGALYRTVTLLAVERGVDLEDEDALAAVVADINVSFGPAEDRVLVFSGDRDVSDEIRTAELTARVKYAARSPKVRAALRPVQRAFAERSPVVMEGRDIGTVIFPDADLKIFLDAPLEERARRRWAELREKGQDVSLEEVERAERERDAADMGREVAPLRRADDAVVVDTGPNTIEATAQQLEAIARERLGSRVARLRRGFAGQAGAGCQESTGTAGRSDTRHPTPGSRHPAAGTRRATRVGLWYRFCRFACRVVCRAYFRLRTFGREHLPEKEAGGLILACNHQSYMDPPLATCLLKRQCRYMARSSLFKFPPFAWLIGSVGAIPVQRGESDRAALRRAEELLKDGWLLTLYPEGTRTRDGYIAEVKPGVGTLAVRAGVPVLPCYIHGAYDAWPRSRMLPLPRPVGVFYGELIELPPEEGMSRRERGRLVHERLERELRRLEKLAFELMPLRTRSAPQARAEEAPVGPASGDPPVRAETEDGQSEKRGAPGEGSAAAAPGAVSNGQS